MHRTLSAAGAFWLAAFTYFIWGFTFLASRIAQDYGTPFVLLFWRFALAFLLLNLLRLTGRFPVRFRSRKLWPVLLAGLCGEERQLLVPSEDAASVLTHDGEREWGAWRDTFKTVGQERGIRFIPMYQVGYESYTTYFPLKRQ